jgi:hypothetical protein
MPHSLGLFATRSLAARYRIVTHEDETRSHRRRCLRLSCCVSEGYWEVSRSAAAGGCQRDIPRARRASSAQPLYVPCKGHLTRACTCVQCSMVTWSRRGNSMGARDLRARAPAIPRLGSEQGLCQRKPLCYSALAYPGCDALTWPLVVGSAPRAWSVPRCGIMGCE